jgi:hypothetical protein
MQINPKAVTSFQKFNYLYPQNQLCLHNEVQLECKVVYESKEKSNCYKSVTFE